MKFLCFPGGGGGCSHTSYPSLWKISFWYFLLSIYDIIQFRCTIIMLTYVLIMLMYDLSFYVNKPCDNVDMQFIYFVLFDWLEFIVPFETFSLIWRRAIYLCWQMNCSSNRIIMLTYNLTFSTSWKWSYNLACMHI